MTDKIDLMLAQLGLMKARESIAAGAVFLPSPGRHVMIAVELDCGDPEIAKTLADEMAAYFAASTVTFDKPGFKATDIVTLRGTVVRIQTTIADVAPAPSPV